MLGWVWRRFFNPGERLLEEREARAMETFRELRRAIKQEDEHALRRLREALSQESGVAE